MDTRFIRTIAQTYLEKYQALGHDLARQYVLRAVDGDADKEELIRQEVETIIQERLKEIT
jgi:hypothetical protein